MRQRSTAENLWCVKLTGILALTLMFSLVTACLLRNRCVNLARNRTEDPTIMRFTSRISEPPISWHRSCRRLSQLSVIGSVSIILPNTNSVSDSTCRHLPSPWRHGAGNIQRAIRSSRCSCVREIWGCRLAEFSNCRSKYCRTLGRCRIEGKILPSSSTFHLYSCRTMSAHSRDTLLFWNLAELGLLRNTESKFASLHRDGIAPDLLLPCPKSLVNRGKKSGCSHGV